MRNEVMNLSEHFTLAELTKTKTGIDNVPNEEQVNNLKRLCRWLEELRRRWNGLYGDGDDPIIINSGFRCPEVNKAVGGWAQSNHLTIIERKGYTYWIHFAVRPFGNRRRTNYKR